MGPPLKAAENRALQSTHHHQRQSFNGAAAKSSGKYEAPYHLQPIADPSMGPPLKAAENRTELSDTRCNGS